MYTVCSRKSTEHTHKHTRTHAHSTHSLQYTAQPTTACRGHSTHTAHRRSNSWQEQLASYFGFRDRKIGEHPPSNSDVVSFLSVAAWILQCCGHPLLYHLDTDPPTHRAAAEGLQVGTACQGASKPSRTLLGVFHSTSLWVCRFHGLP